MMSLIGECSNTSPAARMLKKYHMGRMWARDRIQLRWEGELVGFDNGAYSAWKKGKPFPESQFLKRLDYLLSIRYRNCIVAVLPDIVAQGQRSLEFSYWWLQRLPKCLPWYLAVQDGMRESDVEHILPFVSGLLLGGTNEFKRTASNWCQMAHDAGKLFHWARCTTLNAVRAAIRIGADSCDSTAVVRNMVNGRQARAREWLKIAAGRDSQMALEI